jgi:hypothetical protein
VPKAVRRGPRGGGRAGAVGARMLKTTVVERSGVVSRAALSQAHRREHQLALAQLQRVELCKRRSSTRPISGPPGEGRDLLRSGCEHVRVAGDGVAVSEINVTYALRADMSPPRHRPDRP